MKNKQRKGSRFHPTKSTVAILATAIVVVAIFGFYLFRTHPKATSGTIKTTDTSASTNNSANTTATSTTKASTSQTTDPEKTSTGSQSTSSGTLLSPYGSLVSNHRPGQNGSNMTELSQCVTTPGATCYIKFIQSNVTKTLPVKTVGSDGSASWQWNVSDAGLTSGKWTVAAIASLGDQTKSTTDQLSLEIQ